MKPRRCCLCWESKKHYREVVSPMKEKHATSCQKLLSVDIGKENESDGSLHFCFYCFDTVARFSLITDKFNEIKKLFTLFTYGFSKHVESSRRNSKMPRGIDIQNSSAEFMNIAEKIVSPDNLTGNSKSSDMVSSKKDSSNSEERDLLNDFRRFAVDSCLENFDYSRSALKVPKGAAIKYFQKTVAQKEKNHGKRELRVMIERLNLTLGKVHSILYCAPCKREFTIKSALTNHRNIKHKHETEQESISMLPFKNDSKKAENLIKITNINNTSPEFVNSEVNLISGTVQNIFYCAPCKRKFTTQSGFTQHRNFKHRLDPTGWSFAECAVNNNTSNNIVKTKLHKCDICNNQYRHSSDLNRHRKTVHGVKHPCEQCDLSFSSLYRLQIHVKVRHTMEISFECPLCGKYFANNRNRRVHMKVHAIAEAKNSQENSSS